jgi:hypothetical protein
MSRQSVWTIGALALLPLLGASPRIAGAAAVVELFTSQGCSDCPPADALLGEFARVPGVVALAYHVTYWDALGWHDRFGLRQADERQQYYVRQLRLSTAFTPQAVIDGRVSLIGSDRRAVAAALGESRLTIPVSLGLAHNQVRIELRARALPAPINVIIVGYLPQVATAVGAGENAGHKLQEFDVVRTYDVVGVWRGEAKLFAIPLASLPLDASRIAVLLQGPDGMISGAATLAVR